MKSTCIIRCLRELSTISTIILFTLSSRSSLADHYLVPTGSMEPIVQPNDRVVVNKLAYGVRVPFTDTWLTRWSDPQHGDVVTLKSPEDGTILLKRIAALPGDTVQVVNGQIALNDKLMPIQNHNGVWIEQLGDIMHPVKLSHSGGPDTKSIVRLT